MRKRGELREEGTLREEQGMGIARFYPPSHLTRALEIPMRLVGLIFILG